MLNLEYLLEHLVAFLAIGLVAFGLPRLPGARGFCYSDLIISLFFLMAIAGCVSSVCLFRLSDLIFLPQCLQATVLCPFGLFDPSFLKFVHLYVCFYFLIGSSYSSSLSFFYLHFLYFTIFINNKY